MRILYDPILNDLGHASDKLPSGKSGQHFHVNKDEARLVKGADEVFSFLMVDPGLAPNAGVDLSQERGGNLNIGNPSEKGRRGKPGQVADDPPSQLP